MQIVSTRRTVASEGSRFTAKALMLAAIAAASVTGLGSAVRGDVYENTGNPANFLNTAAAWNDLSAVHAGPPGIADIAQWDAGSNIIAPTTFTLGAGMNWGSIVVTNVGANVTVGSDGQTIALGAGIDMSSVSTGTNNFSFLDGLNLSNAQTFNVAANRSLTLGGVVLNTTLTLAGAGNVFVTGALTGGAGAGSVVQNTTGTVVLTGTNTYTGSYTMNAGTTDINSAGAMGGTNSLIVINGGNIDNTSNGTITLGNQLQSWDQGFTFGGTNSLTFGTGTVNMFANITINNAGNGTFTENGIITENGGSFGLTKTGPGNVTLAGTNAYTGNTTVVQGLLTQNTNQNSCATAAGAFIVIMPGATFATNADAVINENISFQGGTLRFNGYTSSHNFTGVSNATYAGVSNVTLGAANGTASTLGNANSTGGIISNITTGLIYNGPGSLTLASNNTFSGQTVVNAGTLIQNLPNNASNITINAGAVFGIPNDAALGTEGITWNTGTLQFDNYSSNMSFNNITNLALGAANGTPATMNGTISGSKGLVYNGPGSLILANAQLYSGATIVNNGVLVQNFADNNSSIVLNVPGALAINNDAAVGNETITFGGGALQFNNYVSNLTFNNAGLVTLGANVGGFSTLTGNITGNTSLTFTGPGSLSLTGANNYTGPTTLQGGFLLFTGFNNIGTGTAINFTGGGLLYTPGNTTDITTRTVTVSNTTLGNGGTIDINGNNVTFNNTISGNGSLSAQDSQSLNSTHTFTINANMTYTGATGVNGGAVVRLNEVAGPILAGGPLAMGGGTLVMDIGNSTANVTQAFSSTSVNAGQSVIKTNATGAGIPTITLGALTANVGSAIEFIGPATIGAAGPVAATAVITTTTGTANNMLVGNGNTQSVDLGFATVGLYDIAAKDPTNTFIVGGSTIPGFWTFLPAQAGSQAFSGNDDIAAAINGQGVVNHNTIASNVERFNQPGLGILNLTAVNAQNAVLVTPNVGPFESIIAGTAGDFSSSRGATASSLSLIQNNVLGVLDVRTGVGGSKTGPNGLVTSGPGLILMAASSYTGNTYIDGGVLEGAGDSALGDPGSAANLNLAGGSFFANATFALDNGNGTNPRPIVLLGGGGGLAALTSQVLTVDGVISGNGGTLNIGMGQVVGTGAGTSLTTAQFGNGTVIFTGANTYTGNTNVLNGATLQLDSNAGTGHVTAGSADGTSTGTITGNASNLTNKLFINSGSLFNPGHTGIGALTVNSLTLGSDGIGGDPLGGATIDFSLAKSPSNITSVSNQLSLAANGSLTFNGTNFINLFSSGSTAPNTAGGIYILANLNGAAVSGLTSSTFSVADPIPHATYNFSITSGKLQVLVVSSNATGIWATDASGNWSNSANWIGGIVPNSAGSAAVFQNTLGSTPVVVTLDAPQTVGSMQFAAATNIAAPTTYTLNGTGANGITIDLGVTNDGSITAGGGTNTINANVTLAGTGVSIGVNNDTAANQTSVLAVSGIIGDNGQHANISITGTGSVILSANNTYGGSTKIGAGATVQIGNGGTSGSASAGVITDNGILAINRSDGTIASPYLFNNVISAASSGGVTINGTGVVRLTQANAFGGNVNINSGVLQVGAAGTGNITAIGRGDGQSKVIIGAAGKLDLNGFNIFEGSTSGAGNIDNSSATAAVLTEGSGNIVDTLTGTISNSGGGALSIFKTGTSTLVLSGNNTFSGGVNVNAGNLLLNTNTAAGNGTITNSGASVSALLLGNGTLISNNYLINGNNANDDIDVPVANTTATFAGAFQVGGAAQLRVGVGNTTSTLFITGTTVLGGAPIVFLTQNNVVFAGNGSWSVPGSSIEIGREANSSTLNLVMNDNSFISAAGINVAGLGSGAAGDKLVNITMNNNASISALTSSLNLNEGDGGTAGVVNLTMNGNSSIIGSSITMAGTNQGATTLNFNGGTIVATGGDTASAHFFPDFTVTNTTNHTIATNATIQTGGLKVNDGGFAITIDQPLNGGIGDGGFTKSGTGTVTLNGNNQYTGVTNVLAGTLYANNIAGTATGTSDVNVSANASFGGLGVIAGSINALGSNVTIIPGDLGAVGNLTLGTGINNQNVNLKTGDAITINFTPDGSTNSEIKLPNGFVIVNNGGGGNIGYTFLQAGTTTAFDINGTYKIYEEDQGFQPTGETSSVLDPQTGATYTFHPDALDAVSYDVTITGGGNSAQWANAAGGVWTPNTNWTNSITPNNVGDVATFGTNNNTITGNVTVSLTNNETVGNVYFNNTQANYTITGTGPTLILDNGIGGTSSTATSSVTVLAGTHTINVPTQVNSLNLNLVVTNATDSLTISQPISGATGNVTYTGAGNLVLSGNNTFPGKLLLNGSGNVALSGSEATATVLSIIGNANVALSGTNAFTGINKGGTGTMVISVANAYTGATNLTGGTTQLVGAGNLGNGSAVTVNGSNETLDMNSLNLTIGSLAGTTGNVDGAFAGGNATVTNTLTVGTNNSNTSFGASNTSIIKNTTGSLALNKVGTGTLTLAGTNTYTGGTILTGGALSVGADVNLGASANLTATSPANLTFNGGSLWINSTTYLAIPTASNTTNGRNVIWTAAGGGIGVAGSGTTFVMDRDMIGGGFTKTGPGIVALTGNYSTTSPTVIAAGTLELGNNATSNATFSTPSIVDNGVLGFNRAAQNYSVTSEISGTGGLTQFGTGTTTINGNYTATGPITLAAGNITFSATSNARQDTGVVLKMSSLSFTLPTSSLDVTNHDLIIGNSNLTTVNNQILNGFGVSVAGTLGAITSSTALNSGTTFLVPIDATAFGVTSWDNVPVDQPNSIIVKYTYFGDATLDGLVNGDDFGAVITNFGATTPGISNIEQSFFLGDFTLDGVVNGDDFGAVISDFGGSQLVVGNATGSVASPGAVPEPASLFLLALGSAGMLLKRKRRTM